MERTQLIILFLFFPHRVTPSDRSSIFTTVLCFVFVFSTNRTKSIRKANRLSIPIQTVFGAEHSFTLMCGDKLLIGKKHQLSDDTSALECADSLKNLWWNGAGPRDPSGVSVVSTAQARPNCFPGHGLLRLCVQGAFYSSVWVLWFY